MKCKAFNIFFFLQVQSCWLESLPLTAAEPCLLSLRLSLQRLHQSGFMNSHHCMWQNQLVLVILCCSLSRLTLLALPEFFCDSFHQASSEAILCNEQSDLENEHVSMTD